MKAPGDFLSCNKSLDWARGRLETRCCDVPPALDLLEDLKAWEGQQAVVMIQVPRQFADKTPEEHRF